MSRLLLTLFMVLCLSLSCSTARKTPTIGYEQRFSMYGIKSIRHKGNVNIIYATRNDSTFVVISESDNTDIPRQEPIKRGGYYPLELEVVFPLESFHGVKVLPNAGIKGIILSDGTFLRPRRKYHNRIYFAKNLNGIYLRQYTLDETMPTNRSRSASDPSGSHASQCQP